jgi:membrane protein required for colicin V production
MLVVDYLLISLVLVSTAVGVFRGFVKEALSLGVWFVAVWVAFRYSPLAADGLGSWIESPTLRLWAARIVLLILVLVAGGLVNWLIGTLIHKSGLSGTDRMIGMIFGLARGGVLVGVAVVVLEAMGFSEEAWWYESELIPYAAPVADVIGELAARGMEYIDQDSLGDAELGQGI